MLGKLLKYEMKAMGRILLPLYLAMVLAACVFAINMRLNMNGVAKFIVSKFAIITGVLFGAAVMAVGVVMVIMVIQRFYKNLLGTEGYLMFTLPAKTHELILSKAVSTLLWMLLGAAAGAAAGFAMVSITSNWPEFVRQVQELWLQLSPDKSLSPIIWMIVLMIVNVLESVIKVYAALAVGHQFHSHRLAGAVLAYFGFGIVELLLSFIANKLHLFPTGFLSSTTFPGVEVAQFGTLFAVIGLVVYGLLCWYLLDRRLNLE